MYPPQPPVVFCAQSLCHVRHFVNPWTIDFQAFLSMGFSRKGYWSRLPRPPPEDLPNPGTELASLMTTALSDSLPLVPPGKARFPIHIL